MNSSEPQLRLKQPLSVTFPSNQKQSGTSPSAVAVRPSVQPPKGHAVLFNMCLAVSLSDGFDCFFGVRARTRTCVGRPGEAPGLCFPAFASKVASACL